MPSKYFLFLCFSVLPFALISQESKEHLVSHRMYGVEDGLGSKSVQCGLQDDDGFLWFGTKEGLNRFDGKTFLLFTKQRNGLYENKVSQMAIDRHRHLILCYGMTTADQFIEACEVMDLNTHKIRPLKEIFPNAPFRQEEVEWVRNINGAVYFWLKGGGYWRLADDQFELAPDEYDPMITEEQLMSVWHELAAHLSSTMKIDASVPNYYKPFPSANLAEYAFFNPVMGLCLYADRQITPLIHATDWAEYKDIETIRSHFRDQMGNRWFCTSAGLLKVELKKNRFAHYFTRAQNPISFYTNQARGIYVDEKGIVYANIWHYLCASNGEVLPEPNWGNVLFRHQATFYGGSDYLFEFNPVTKTFTKLSEAFKSEKWCVYPLSKDELLVGTNFGFFRFHIPTRTFTDSLYIPPGIPRPKVGYRIIKASDQRIWAACENGLFVFNDQGNAVIDYYGKRALRWAHRKPFDNLYDLLEDSDGIFWLATSGEGLYRWDRKANLLSQFTKREGLPSNIVYRLEEDGFHHLWISTECGLSRLNTKDFLISTYTEKDGITDNEFNRISSFEAPDGRMFFGGMDGINAFYPKDFVNDTTQYEVPLRMVSFSQFNAGNKTLEDRTVDLRQNPVIVVKPGDQFFTMEFRLLNYEEEQSRYAYMIEGIDKDWNYINENSIRISGLPYGDFTLRIKGQGSNGEWSNSILSFPISVIKPIYLRWWFILLCVALIIGAIILFFRWRTSKLLADKQKLEVAVSQRTEQLSDLLGQKTLMMKEIHHRVKNNLQVISGLLELQQARSKDQHTKAALLESQNRVLSIAFIHQNLYQHDELKGVEMQTFAVELCNHIHYLFFNEHCPVTIEKNIEPLFLDIDTAVPLGLIINELLTNSYKYAFIGKKNGKIEIVLKKNAQGNYYFYYRDNGKGLPPDLDLKKVNSLGLRLITRLSKQLGGEIKYTFENGSSFQLDFKDFEERNNMT